jgi:hypothetical protein
MQHKEWLCDKLHIKEQHIQLICIAWLEKVQKLATARKEGQQQS